MQPKTNTVNIQNTPSKKTPRHPSPQAVEMLAKMIVSRGVREGKLPSLKCEATHKLGIENESGSGVDWRSVSQDHRDRVTHILGIFGTVAGYPLATEAAIYVRSIGYGDWWDPLAFWVLVPSWLLFVGFIAMQAPKLLFYGLISPRQTHLGASDCKTKELS